MDNRWHCDFCHRFEKSGTERHLHGACGKLHECCPKCFKQHAKVTGEFPSYVLVINACPPAPEPGTCDRCAPKISR